MASTEPQRTSTRTTKQLAAWRAFLRAHSTMLRRISRDLDEAGLPPLAWYDVLAALRDAPEQRLRQVELAERVLLSNSGLSRLLDRIEKQGPRRGARAAPTRPAQLLHRAHRRGREMLERMWPVYARGIADDFLPALGSNPCEIRQTLESIGAPVRRGAGGGGRGGRRSRAPLARQARAELDELARVAVRRPVADEHELRLELAEALGRAAVVGRVRGEVALRLAQAGDAR